MTRPYPSWPRAAGDGSTLIRKRGAGSLVVVPPPTAVPDLRCWARRARPVLAEGDPDEQPAVGAIDGVSWAAMLLPSR